jgi:hypothetical protein
LKSIPLALCYDFDGTLAPGNMQERDFIPTIGMGVEKFWQEVVSLSEEHEGDQILMYMRLMLERASHARVPVRREDFEQFGRKLEFFPGVYDEEGLNWFERITRYGDASGLDVKHYVISSGIREMIAGTKIGHYFDKIYASSFLYDHHGVAIWPALAVNYTTKTQYLFRINKGSLSASDNSLINRYVEPENRAVPFPNIVFLGDGETDIPCFRLVKDMHGHSIAVFQQGNERSEKVANTVFSEKRVNFATPADYREGSELDRIVKGIIDKIAFDTQLKSYGQL